MNPLFFSLCTSFRVTIRQSHAMLIILRRKPWQIQITAGVILDECLFAPCVTWFSFFPHENRCTWLVVFISNYRAMAMQRSWTQCKAENGVSHFHLSPPITLKDVGSQHGCIRGFTQEPTVVEVSLDLQEDEIPTKDKDHIRQVSLLGYQWYSYRTAPTDTEQKE